MNAKGEVQNEVQRRMQSPFYGSLLVAFAILNWKAIVILIHPHSDLDVFARLDWISSNLYGVMEVLVLKVYVGPLLAAILVPYLLPFLLNELERLRIRAAVSLHNIQIEGEEAKSDVKGAVNKLEEAMHVKTREYDKLEEKLRGLEATVLDCCRKWLRGDRAYVLALRDIVISDGPVHMGKIEADLVRMGFAARHKNDQCVPNDLGRKVFVEMSKGNDTN